MNREEHIHQYALLNHRFENAYRPRIEKAIKAKISSLISHIRHSGLEAGRKYLHTSLANFEMKRVVESLYETVGLRHAKNNERRLRAEVQKSSSFDMEVKRFGLAEAWIRFIQDYLRAFLIEKITFKVNETTRDSLLLVMNEAIEKGWGVDETVKRLENLPLTATQAQRIVRTEVNRAANVGVKAQGETFAYELTKEWISVLDRRTRGNPVEGSHDHSDHWDMNGQTVDFYDLFRDSRNGHTMDFPGDPKASAEDVIFCRCNHTTHPKRDERGRLIPKKKTVYVEYPRTRERQIVTV